LISNDAAEEFRRACEHAFGFVSAYGFSGGRLTIDSPTQTITVRFCGKQIAIECIWDDREQALEVKICRLREGEPPSEFAVDASGRRVRGHLTQILLRRGVRAFPFRKVPPGAALADLWQSHLEDYASILQQHGRDILEELPGVLD
jgi:hypothetical protein